MKVCFTKRLGVVLILVFAIALCGCGKTVTLKDWLDTEEFEALVAEIKEEAKAFGSADVYVEGNTLFYKFYYSSNTVFDMSDLKVKAQVLAYFDEQMESYQSDASNEIATIEKKTRLDDVAIVYEFYNGDGTLMYTKTFTE